MHFNLTLSSNTDGRWTTTLPLTTGGLLDEQERSRETFFGRAEARLDVGRAAANLAACRVAWRVW